MSSESKILNNDPLGEALLDFMSGKKREFIKVHSSLGEEDNLWVKQFFRNYLEMPEVERVALSQCKGKILDVGAGAGAHSLYLQNKAYDVYPIDVSPGATKVMNERGLKNTRCKDFFNLDNEKYDTILMLMNGIGIVGAIKSLEQFFLKVSSLLNPDGVLIFDSSDIIYMFEDEIGNFELDHETYYGEVKYTMTYNKIKGKPFKWLFIDFDTLKTVAEKCNFKAVILTKQSNNAYTCICTKEI